MTTAIILAAGQGKRMGTAVPKQFLEIDGIPVIVRTLRVFDESPLIDRIILVAQEDYTDYCRTEIIERYGFSKNVRIVAGGKERYQSVWNALLVCEGTDYVMIHDGARPFADQKILARADEAMRKYGAAAAGMPSKDTVKIADDDGFAVSTPDRSHVWIIQTPQAFSYSLIRKANELLMAEDRMAGVTDDAMIVEASGLARVRLFEGSYKNIKITTPEDLRAF